MGEGRRDLRSMAIAVVVTGAVLGIGSLVLQRWVASTRGAAIALVAIWFVVVLVGIFVVLRRSPQARAAALGTLAIALLVTLAVGYWTGFRETEVNEDVAVAATEATGAEREAGLAGEDEGEAPAEAMSLGTGEVVGADGHAGTGNAEIIEEPTGDRVLTLTDLDVDPGPDVDVLLSASPENIDDAVNLGGLKGSNGNQEYAVPADTNLMEHPNVILWCNPFTVRIAVAELDV